MSNATDNSYSPAPTPSEEPARTPSPQEGNVPPGGTGGSPWIYSDLQQTTPGYYTPPAPPIPPPATPTPPTAPTATPGASGPESMPPSTPPIAAAPSVPGGGAPRKPVPQPTAARALEHVQKGDQSLASVIDTIEAIIIALIIALTFRAFVVEAFVIPTGSMAPTLLGAHFKVICPACGYTYDRDASLGYQIREVGRRHIIPGVRDNQAELITNTSVPCDATTGDLPIYCPNCLNPIRPEQLPQYTGEVEVEDGRQHGLIHNVSVPWANNGDRILVLKYLYPIVEPNRWDVIVFKEPQAASTNFIKRCTGLPGETLEIIGGDIYVNATGAEPDERTRFIARKPEHIQQSVWQLVYDNDFYPADEDKPRPHYHLDRTDGTTWAWENPWIPTTHSEDWNRDRPVLSTGRHAGGPLMTYSGAGAGGLQFVVPRQRDSVDPYTFNVLGYSNDFYPSGNDTGPRHPVGDLRMEALWAPATSGPLTLTLGRPDNCFQVTWTDAGVELARYNEKTRGFDPVKAEIVADAPRPEGGKSYHVAMNNVDHSIQFYVDGRRILHFEQTWSARDAREQEAAEEAAGRAYRPDAEIRIEVNGPCTLAHLKVLRDLYYTQTEAADYARTANEGNPITLGKDEFFAMGDNSRHSLDSRMWTEVYSPLDDLGTRKGIVPRRYLLGRAFFVYWPAGYRPAEKVPLLSSFPLVPNTGDMRFIR